MNFCKNDHFGLELTSGGGKFAMMALSCSADGDDDDDDDMNGPACDPVSLIDCCSPSHWLVLCVTQHNCCPPFSENPR